MLVLTRAVGEVLRIGDDIEIKILAVRGGQVRIGTTAPNNVTVHRQEIYERIQEEKLMGEKLDKG